MIYSDTTNVDYTKKNSFKTVSEESFGNEYLNFIILKFSINIPLDTKIKYSDSTFIINQVNQFLNKFEIKKRTNISVYVFYETNYTNDVLSKKESYLFCDENPCLIYHSATVNNIHEWQIPPSPPRGVIASGL